MALMQLKYAALADKPIERGFLSNNLKNFEKTEY